MYFGIGSGAFSQNACQSLHLHQPGSPNLGQLMALCHANQNAFSVGFPSARRNKPSIDIRTIHYLYGTVNYFSFQPVNNHVSRVRRH